MKTTDFITKYKPCLDGAAFASEFETMSEVWQSCQRPDWLFWILEKRRPLKKEQSVKLAIAFAESALVYWTDETDKRPALAIQAAKNWLENPCDESAESAAWSAAWSAESAESAAWLAAWSARTAALSAAWSARSAAWLATRLALSAAAACDQIRNLIPNPFES